MQRLYKEERITMIVCRCWTQNSPRDLAWHADVFLFETRSWSLFLYFICNFFYIYSVVFGSVKTLATAAGVHNVYRIKWLNMKLMLKQTDMDWKQQHFSYKIVCSVSPTIVLGGRPPPHNGPPAPLEGQVNCIFSIAPDHNRSHLKLPSL